MRYVYPAVFMWYEPEKIYIVKFPDAEGVLLTANADTELYRDILHLRKILDMKKRANAKKFIKTPLPRRVAL